MDATAIRLTAADGFILDAWQVRPAGTPRGGLVIIQEIFGINHHIRTVASSYAAEGYTVVAPALFDRLERGVELAYDEAGTARGRELGKRFDRATGMLDLAAAIAHLTHAGKVGVIGYCLGGSLAYLASARLDGLAAAVAYYGTLIARSLDEGPRVPVLLHFGEQDPSTPSRDVASIRSRLPEAEVYTYAAGHGFNCDERNTFDPISAAEARVRTLRFLTRWLDSGPQAPDLAWGPTP